MKTVMPMHACITCSVYRHEWVPHNQSNSELQDCMWRCVVFHYCLSGIIQCWYHFLKDEFIVLTTSVHKTKKIKTSFFNTQYNIHKLLSKDELNWSNVTLKMLQSIFILSINVFFWGKHHATTTINKNKSRKKSC